MKKILLTTIFCLCVAFVEGETFYIGRDIKVNMAQPSISIQNQIKKVLFDDENISNQLSYVRGLLIKRCEAKKTNRTVNKDPGDSILFQRLQRIFPDIKHLYYCYNCDNNAFSFFITSEDVKIDASTFLTKTKIPCINFAIDINANDNTYKLREYYAAYGNNSRLLDSLAFYREFSTK